MSIAEDLYENSTSQSAILNGGKSLIDSYLDSSSTATLGSRSSTVLKLRRSYAVMRDAHHHGLVNAPQSLSQLRNDFISRKHPLITSSSLPSLSSGGSSLLGHQQRRSLRRPRKGLQPAPRTKAEKELLYDSKRGSIFSKYKPQSGLPQRKSHKKGTHPAGFAGKRTKQKEKLYKLNAGTDADAIRAYHTLSANMVSQGRLELSLYEETDRLQQNSVNGTPSQQSQSQPPINSGYYASEQDAAIAAANQAARSSSPSPFDLSTMNETNVGSITSLSGMSGMGSLELDADGSQISGIARGRPEQEHFHPGMFGMATDDMAERGDGTSDFGSDFGGNGQQNMGKGGSKWMTGGTANNKEQATGPYRFLFLAPPGSGKHVTVNNGGLKDGSKTFLTGADSSNNNNNNNNHNDEQEMHPGSFCPATPLGRRIYRERKQKSAGGHGDGTKMMSVIGTNVEDELSQTHTQVQQAQAQQSQSTLIAGQTGSMIISSGVGGWNIPQPVQPNLPDDIHGWGGNGQLVITERNHSLARLEASVIGAHSLDALGPAVIRANVGGVTSTVLTSSSTTLFNSNSNTRKSHSSQSNRGISPPRKGSLNGDGPVVLPSISSYPNSLPGSDGEQGDFHQHETENRISSSGSSSSPKRSKSKSRSRGRSRTKKKRPTNQNKQNSGPESSSGGEGIASMETNDWDALGGWEDDRGDIFNKISSMGSTGSTEFSGTSRTSGKSGSYHSTATKKHSRRRPRSSSNSPSRSNAMDANRHRSLSPPKIFVRERGRNRIEPPLPKNGRNYFLVTVRVLEKSQPQRSRATDIGHRSKPFGKAPNEGTTRTVQMNVREETTVVEMVSFVVRRLNLQSGLRWNCQYLDRQESRFKTVVRNHSAAILASPEFQGIGPDGIQIRLVAPKSKETHKHQISISSPQQDSMLDTSNGDNNGDNNGNDSNSNSPNTGTSVPSNISNVPSDRTVVVHHQPSTAGNGNEKDIVTMRPSSRGSDSGVNNSNTTDSNENNASKQQLKRFVMRSTPTRTIHRRNMSNQNSTTNSNSNTSYSSQPIRTTWETPLFELEGWGDVSPTHSRRFDYNRKYKSGGEDEEEEDDTVDMYDTTMEDYSSPVRHQTSQNSDDFDENGNKIVSIGAAADEALSKGSDLLPERIRQQRLLQQQRIAAAGSNNGMHSPIDHDITHARLSSYGAAGGRMPYYLASTHLLVDDEIDRKKNSKNNRKEEQKNGANGFMNGVNGNHFGSGTFKLPNSQEPLLNKMNVLAKSIVSNFGVRKKGNSQFRKALDQRTKRKKKEKEQRKEDEIRRLQKEKEEEEGEGEYEWSEGWTTDEEDENEEENGEVIDEDQGRNKRQGMLNDEMDFLEENIEGKNQIERIEGTSQMEESGNIDSFNDENVDVRMKFNFGLKLKLK